MVITDEIISKNGFENNHPERVLGTYYAHNSFNEPEYRIMLEKTYVPNSNELGYMVTAWNTSNGIINKRASASVIYTTEELQSVINLCNINKTIEV